MTDILSPPNLKPFDLRIGDIILAEDKILDGKHKFVVTHISKYIFEGKRLDGGYVRGFRKDDYRRGEIVRAEQC
jgi:hypothetical protein